MKRVKLRPDLISKSDYNKKFGTSRKQIDKNIESGLWAVERIGKFDYIILSSTKN